MVAHRNSVRVYLEDTDAQGVVYHANYLKYCERSRTDILGTEGYELGKMQAEGWTFVVHEMKLSFRRPAHLHDSLEVLTTAKRTSEFRIVFSHQVLREGDPKPLLTATADVVAIGANGSVVPMPDGLLSRPVE